MFRIYQANFNDLLQLEPEKSFLQLYLELKKYLFIKNIFIFKKLTLALIILILTLKLISKPFFKF